MHLITADPSQFEVLQGPFTLATLGHTPLAHIKTMITGWEDPHTDVALGVVPEADVVSTGSVVEKQT
ncbi:hypothetical protein [Nitrincola schmidtii]|uniref:hypothetical protein n=1 Tax=Nitrincola schmidtii TaxID=1730894 RepID=UPI001980C3BB|nr:hypothetical protein [Nitrincola schmidtii]